MHDNFNLNIFLLYPTLDLDQLLQECASFIQPSGQTWTERITNLGQSWASVRSKILKAVLQNQYIPSASHCVICKDAKGCIRCHQCGPKNLLCFSCDEEYHKLNPLHDRDIFHEGFFQPVAPTVSLDSNGDLITTGMLILISNYYSVSLKCVVCI